MAGLTRVFKMATTRFCDALKNNDAEEMERLRTKKSEWFSLYLSRMNYGEISPQMADVFINKFTTQNWQGWGFSEQGRNAVLDKMFCDALFAGREDLFEPFFNAGIRLNEGKASQHVIHYTLKSEKLSDAKKAGFISRLLESGIGKVTDTEHFARYAVEKNCPQSFDLLTAATKEDIHRDNESLLRFAAEQGHKEMCLHLVQKRGANLELAITTDRTLGREKGWLFLETMRQELRPNDAPPPTIDSLSRRVEELEKTVRELTEALKKPQVQVAAAQLKL